MENENKKENKIKKKDPLGNEIMLSNYVICPPFTENELMYFLLYYWI